MCLASSLCGAALSGKFHALNLTPQGKEHFMAQQKVVGVNAPRKANVNSSTPLLYEDFDENESWGSDELPSGWVSVATPGYAADKWECGTLYTTSGRVAAPSGECYAYILTQLNAHDAWLFSPAFSTVAGSNYVLTYRLLMVGDGDGVTEEMTVMAGYGTTADNMTIDLQHFDTDSNGWAYATVTFTATETGDCHIGFHATSPALGSGILIDNVSVCPPHTPAFSADDTLTLEDRYDKDAATTEGYLITNIGSSNLEVELEDASPEITVLGLPVTIEPGNIVRIGVKLDVESVGLYEGEFTLATNDPNVPTFTVKVSQNINEAYYTGFWFENFDTQLPTTWSSNYMYLDTQLGINGTGCAALTSQVDCYANTHFTDLGDDPHLKFYYRFIYTDWFNGGYGVTPSEDTYLTVSLSVDGGATFEPIYVVDPSIDSNTREATVDFTEVELSLKEYAGKIGMLRFDVPNHYVNYMFYSKCYLDNVELGTPKEHDLKATNLRFDPIMEANAAAKAQFTIHNNGNNAESGFSVILRDEKNNKVLAQVDNCAIDKGADKTFEFSWQAAEATTGTLVAKISLDGDHDTSNDATAEAQYAVLPSVVRDLQFESDKDLTTNVPWDFYSNGSLTQMIYTANEIGINQCTIYGISYVATTSTDFDSENVELWIGETTKSDFSDNEWVDTSVFKKVFSSSVYLKGGTNELDVPFDEPYQYHGGNLVIYATRNNDYFLDNNRFTAFATDTPRTIYLGTIREDVDVANPAQNGGASILNLLPATKFYLSQEATGSISGTIVEDLSNLPMEGVTVTIDGTMQSVSTNSNGQYSFPAVTPGTYSLTASKYGYHSQSKQASKLQEGATVEANFALKTLSTATVSGRITDASTGNPLPGAGVVLSGYATYYGVSGEDGTYTINDVYWDVESYNVEVLAGTYWGTSSQFTMDSGSDASNYDFAIEPRRYAPCNVAASLDDSGSTATITWDDPIAEFRYDSGVPADYSGFEYNFINNLYYAIEGNSFDDAAVVREISWHTSSLAGSHPRVNLFLFPLDATGYPINTPILEITVDNVDDEWNTYTLPSPVEAPDGFLVAMSYSNGMMGISTAKPTADYPLDQAKGWYHNDFSETYGPEYGVKFYESDFDQIFMIRARGYNNGAIDHLNLGNRYKTAMPVPTGYNVYRVEGGARSLVGSYIQGNEFVDQVPAGMSTTTYYAVEAIYGSKTSDLTQSNDLAHSGIETLHDNVSLTIKSANNGNTLIINNQSSDNAILVVYSMSGAVVMQESVASGTSIVDTSMMPRGIYIVRAIACGKVTTHKLIKR